MTGAPTSASTGSSPSVIRNASLPRSLRGFDEAATRKLLGEVAAVVESLTAEREHLRRQVESLQAAPGPDGATAGSSNADESPEALGNAILAAKHAGEELIAAAREEANQILAAATAEADRLAEQARASTAEIDRELDEQRAQFERDRADHEQAVSEWSAKVEAEKEAMMVRARAEAEAVLASSEQAVSELKREREETERLISERRAQFVAMLQAALAELEPLVSVNGADESGDGDLPGALRTRAGSTTRRRGEHHGALEASPQ